MAMSSFRDHVLSSRARARNIFFSLLPLPRLNRSQIPSFEFISEVDLLIFALFVTICERSQGWTLSDVGIPSLQARL